MNKTATINDKVVANNFAEGIVDATCITGEFKINKLDLSKLGNDYTISITNKIESATSSIGWNDIVIVDIKGNKLVQGVD